MYVCVDLEPGHVVKNSKNNKKNHVFIKSPTIVWLRFIYVTWHSYCTYFLIKK